MAAKVVSRKGKRGTTYSAVCHEGQKRHIQSFGTDRKRAEAAAKAWNAKRAAERLGFVLDAPEAAQPQPEPEPPAGPCFRDFAPVYLAHRQREWIKATYARDLEQTFRKGGPLAALLNLPLEALTTRHVDDWLETTADRARGTRKKYLSALSGCLAYAVRKGHAERNVCRDASALRDGGRTAAARAEAAEHARPFESVAEIARLLEAAHAEDGRTDRRGSRSPWTLPLVLLLLDGGLRFGEARGLHWGDIAWGCDAGDRSRELRIARSIASGTTAETTTKSGRERSVPLSRRLRAALRERWVAEGQPGPDVLVFPGLDDNNFRRREWARVCTRARLGKRNPKDLRDTYASWLLQVGVRIELISRHLGHSDIAITQRHYAKWLPGEDVDPYLREPGEVWADFLARLPGAEAEGQAEAATVG